MDYFIGIDIAVFRWLNSWAGASPFSDGAIMFHATYLWYVVIGAVASIAFVPLIFPRARAARARNLQLAANAGAAAIASRFIITELTRFFYSRSRPFEVLSDVIRLVPHAAGGSFPSGHAAASFAVAAAVAFYYPKAGIFFYLAAIGIGIGRVAAGVHWPSDILGGASAGVAAAIFVQVVLRRPPLKSRASGSADSSGLQ